MKSRTNNRRNQVRIIAGDWRGRKLDFPDAEGLRPTPDRVRETLFNWLQPYLPGAHCLDLFAGSGVLGFEAMSRGAASVSFVERERSVYQSLDRNIDLLGIKAQVSLKQADALQYLQADDDSEFDIIFLDPPYGKGLVEKCLLSEGLKRHLKVGSLVYMEHEVALGEIVLSRDWSVLKNKKAGHVNYYLLRYNPDSSVA